MANTHKVTSKPIPGKKGSTLLTRELVGVRRFLNSTDAVSSARKKAETFPRWSHDVIEIKTSRTIATYFQNEQGVVVCRSYV